MKKYNIKYFNRREEILRRHTIAKNPNRKRSRLDLAGLDVYLCLHAKQAKMRTTPVLRNSSTLRCGCKARFTIQFSHGYEHTPDNELNVDTHGNKNVKITWFWKHECHEINSREQYSSEPLSTDARNLLKCAVLYHGVIWIQIQRLQTELVWSFCFMSVKQNEMFSRNSRIIHLDSTHKTCHGLEQTRMLIYLPLS